MTVQIKLFFILCISALTLTFSACSDDDNNIPPIIDNGTAIAGEYEGDFEVIGQDSIKGVFITFTRITDNKVNINIKKEYFPDILLQDINCEVLINADGAGYIFLGTTKGKDLINNDLDITVNSGYVEKNSMGFLVSIKQDITILRQAKFEGTKLLD